MSLARAIALLAFALLLAGGIISAGEVYSGHLVAASVDDLRREIIYNSCGDEARSACHVSIEPGEN